MRDGLRALWSALIGLYDESTTFLRSNLAALAVDLPLILLVALVTLPFADPVQGELEVVWPWVLGAWSVLFFPSPGQVGMGQVALTATTRESPRYQEFRSSLRDGWRRGLVLYLLGMIGSGILLGNVYFYAAVLDGWPRAFAVLWLYLLVLWLTLQAYLVPLWHRLGRPRLRDQYGRAALLVLARPLLSLTLLAATLLIAAVGVGLLPVYVLGGHASVALVRAHAFRLVRLQIGDLVEEEFP